MALFGIPGASWDDPWTAFDELRRELGGVLGSFSRESSRIPRSTVFPPVNLYESDDAWVMTAEIPGLRAEDLDVSVDEARITLRGERKIEIPDHPGVSLHRRERQAGIFRRTVELPGAPDPSRVEAAYRDGVLRVKLAKPARRQPRQIEIQAS